MPTLHVPMPNGGLADPSALSNIPKDKAFAVQNFLVDQPGQLRARGPLGTAADLYGASSTRTGIWVHGETILAADGTTLNAKFYDTNAGGAAVNVVLTDATRRMEQRKRSARLGAYAYGQSFDTTTGLLRWNGTPTEPTIMTHAPCGSADVAVYLNRLFVAGGTEPNTTTPEKANSLWWTDIGGPATNTLADWQDDVSGLTNQLVIGDDGDEIVALAPMPGQLLVFKRNSIWTVLGNSPATFSVRRLISTMGGGRPQETLVVDNLCLFLNSEGLPYAFDGVELSRLANRRMDADGLGSIARLPSNYVLWTAPFETSYLLHVPTRSWATLTFDTAALGTNMEVLNTEFGKPYVVDDRYLRSLEGVTSEGAGFELDFAGTADVAIEPQLITRAYELVTPESYATVDRLYVGHLLTDLGTGTGTPEWTVELLDLSTNPIATFTVGDTPLTLSRSVVDAFVETPELILRVTYAPAGGVPNATLQLEDIYAEWRPAQRKGST